MPLDHVHKWAAALCAAGLIPLLLICPCRADQADQRGATRAGPPAQGSSAAAPRSTAGAAASTSGSADRLYGGDDATLLRWFKGARAREILSRFAPSLSLYYARSVADYDSSDFGHSLGLIGELAYSATPSLIFSTSLALYRQLGEEYERFVASNWYFDVTRTFNLPYAGVLFPHLFFMLPTNPDDGEYLTYRGSVGIDVELRKHNFYRFHKDHAVGGSVGFITARNIYGMTHNETGYPNRLWQVSAYATLSYKFRQSFLFIYKFKNNWFWYPEGDRANDIYYQSFGFHVQPITRLWVGLSAVSEDRTFLYDQVTSNVALYAAKATRVIFSLTYLPRIVKTHELSH